MKEIQKISDRIEKEIDNAECYAMDALEQKDVKSGLAEISYKLANERLADIGLLHTQVATMIEDYRKEKGEPPEGMKILYDILHKKHISKVAAIKGMLALYKES